MARPKHPERCGNRTKGPDRNVTNIDDIVLTSKVSAEIVRQAKELTKARRARSPVRVENIPAIMDAFDSYAIECMNTGRPMTWAGFALAAGISSMTLDRMRKGELDHIIDEYRLLHDVPEDVDTITDENGVEIPLLPWSVIAEKCGLLIQDQLESNCYQLKGNQVGSIFGLKARFGWQDEHQPLYVDKQLVIADKDRANEMLAMLKSE